MQPEVWITFLTAGFKTLKCSFRVAELLRVVRSRPLDSPVEEAEEAKGLEGI